MSNTFKLPEIILNNLKNESNTDENIFCVYNYVQEHINNGVFESLNFVAADFILKSVYCDLNWPTDE